MPSKSSARKSISRTYSKQDNTSTSTPSEREKASRDQYSGLASHSSITSQKREGEIQEALETGGHKSMSCGESPMQGRPGCSNEMSLTNGYYISVKNQKIQAGVSTGMAFCETLTSSSKVPRSDRRRGLSC